MSALRLFLLAVEADSADAPDLVEDAARAEPRVQNWPSSLPDRATVQAIISFLQAARHIMIAFRANSPLTANFMPIVNQIVQAANRIDERRAPRAWAAAQVSSLELISQSYSLLRDNAAASQGGDMVTAFRRRVEPLLADERRFAPLERARLLAALGRMYAPPPAEQRPSDDVAAGIEFFRQASRLALSASAPGRARDYLVRAATATLRNDPSGRAAEALLAAEEQSGPRDWLRRRSIYELQMRIAEARDDPVAHDAVAQLWMSALIDDLQSARIPFWAAMVDGHAQDSYLAGPLRRNDAATALARFDRLAEAVQIQGTAESPGLAETSAGAPAAAAAQTPPRPDELGVDLIVIGVGDDHGAGLASSPISGVMQATAGSVEPMAAAAWIDWGALSARAGRVPTPAIRSAVDPRLMMVETGRGLAGLLPSALQAMGAPALTAAQIQAFRDGMAGQIPVFESQFFAAFGKPIDDLAGGRCAAARPLSGPVPRILLILPASLSFFPVEMARAPNGRRLIDCYEFRRAPTLAAARQSAARWPRHGRLRGIAGVWNPQGDLPDAEAERSLIAAAARDGHVIVPLDPTSADTILRPAGGADILHIAGHGRLGVLDPFESSVAVAPGHLLTFREIVASTDPATVRLVVLSACEAGLSTPQSGEIAYWGMASSFLTAGAAGVVGALWQVGDDPAALVMGKFYELLLRRNRPPAAALREAQLWLRDASAEELIAFVQASMAFADESGKERLAGLVAAISQAGVNASGAPPYADPMLWGGFGYYGTYANE